VTTRDNDPRPSGVAALVTSVGKAAARFEAEREVRSRLTNDCLVGTGQNNVAKEVSERRRGLRHRDVAHTVIEAG
jgi:hypothetical protein